MRVTIAVLTLSDQGPVLDNHCGGASSCDTLAHLQPLSIISTVLATRCTGLKAKESCLFVFCALDSPVFFTILLLISLGFCLAAVRLHFWEAYAVFVPVISLWIDDSLMSLILVSWTASTDRGMIQGIQDVCNEAL